MPRTTNMTENTNTSDFRHKRRKTLQLIGASAGTAVLSETASASETTRTQYAELGIRYEITSSNLSTRDYTYYEMDTPKLFQVRFDGIHLDKFTPQKTRDLFTGDHPVIYNNQAKPASGDVHGSIEKTLLPTKLGDAFRAVRGVNIETSLQEPQIVAVMAGSTLNITSQGNKAQIQAGEEREIRLNSSDVSVQVTSPDGTSFEDATAIPVIQVKNYGEQRVYE